MSNLISRDTSIMHLGKSSAKLPLGVVFRLVLRFIYNINGDNPCEPPDRPMSMQDISDMENSILNWFKWIQTRKGKLADKYGAAWLAEHEKIEVGKKGTVLDEIENYLQRLAWMLRENDLGNFDYKKKTFKEHKISYKKHFKLPEAFKPEDFKRAQEFLKAAMRDNPDDYRKE